MNQITSSPLDFEELFRSVGTAYIVFDIDDPHFTIIDENQAHADMAMVERSAVIGKPVLEAFPDTSREYIETGRSRLIESIRKVIRTGKSDMMPDLSYDLKDQNGVLTTKFWQVTHYPVFEDKKVRAVCQQTKDITERIVTHRQLTLTQQQLEQALTYSAVGTWMWELKDNMIVADKNLAKLFGLADGTTQVEVPLEEFIASIHPDDTDRVQKDIKDTLAGSESYESEYRVLDSTGAIRWVLARGKVEFDASGKPIRFPGLVVDITERKIAESSLHLLAKANTQFSASLDYRQTLHTIASMIVPSVTDWCSIYILEDGKIEQVAIAHKDPEKVKWAKELQQEQGEIDMDAPTGVPWVMRTGQVEYIPRITDEMLQAAAKNKEELKLLRDVGIHSAITVPLKIDGKVIGAISFVSTESHRHYGQNDVEVAQALANRAALAVYNANLFNGAKAELKQRKKLQKELERLNEALETRVKQRTEQLEKTNQGLSDEIVQRHKVEAELQEYSKSLSRSNQELQDFAYVASHDLQEPLRKIRAFGDILESEYSKELGDGVEYLQRMQNAASRMSILIEDLLAFSRVSTKQPANDMVDLNEIAHDVVGDLEIQIERTKGTVTIGELPTIEADATHMRQLFQNLIGNALKFHREDIAPVVKVYTCDEDRAKGLQTICIEDNGIGFDEKYLDRIFSVFQRLHSKDSYEGTGIGLAVVRKITERYGGTITASSKKGTGSTFKVTFPIIKKEKKA
ncbi:MAG: ATP-binding protein [Candidatus Saccharimonadales bacterium]